MDRKWCHSFGRLYYWNHQTDDMFSVFSTVTSVRLSVDGKYLATACNCKAYIYDTETGAETWFDLSAFLPIDLWL